MMYGGNKLKPSLSIALHIAVILSDLTWTFPEKNSREKDADSKYTEYREMLKPEYWREKKNIS